MTEHDIRFRKKETYTYAEVREMLEHALMERAATVGFFYKTMPRELFDLYAKKALYALGRYRAQNKYFETREKGDVMAMVDFLDNFGNGVSSTVDDGNYCVEHDEEHAIVNMDGKCALVLGWERMGLSPEEVDYLCQITGYGDFGQCEGLGLRGEWLQTSAQPGCANCVLKITKLNGGKPAIEE
ncbi:hypothetical protein [Pseudoflavonifractor phocaeensis]|uniref:hypothetical protein n=1 Tax=Pseudoflavonifractor phocaeensis TaxID=1870988 RepID=UPI00210880A2|nr:hypothetical protein [Pseudoflavonifractor phocaeensis]MCQ4865312.1 hypothetical protein [Pseudoflavonifractor phocaeensis]